MVAVKKMQQEIIIVSAKKDSQVLCYVYTYMLYTLNAAHSVLNENDHTIYIYKIRVVTAYIQRKQPILYNGWPTRPAGRCPLGGNDRQEPCTQL